MYNERNPETFCYGYMRAEMRIAIQILIHAKHKLPAEAVFIN